MEGNWGNTASAAQNERASVFTVAIQVTVAKGYHLACPQIEETPDCPASTGERRRIDRTLYRCD